jgi:hypothetical protein
MANFYGQYTGFGAGGVATVFTVATGGNAIETVGDYKIHAFTGTGSATFDITTLGTDNTFDVLVVAGGGGGGFEQVGGGGGAGGLIYQWSRWCFWRCCWYSGYGFYI